MADDGRLAFDIALMDDAFQAQAERIKEQFKAIGDAAVNEGKHIDQVFAELSKGYDVSTVEARMKALLSVISENESAIVSLNQKINKMDEDAKKALADEDYSTYRKLREDITRAQSSVADITAETANFKHVLKEVEQAAGKVTSSLPNETIRFFKTEDDYNHVKELNSQIDELKVKLSETSDQEGINTINGQIIELQKELDAANKSAAEAASSLGDKLGSRAAEVSTRFYELNAAVKEQEGTVAKLKQDLAEAEDKLNNAVDKDDVEEVKSLQQEYQHLAEQVRNAEDALSGLKGEQKDADDAFDELQEVLEATKGSIGGALSGFRGLTRVIKGGSNPLQIFGAALTAIGSAARISMASIKALWATIMANPLGLILAAVAAVVAIMAKLISSIESTAERQKTLNDLEKNHLALLQQISEYRTSKVDDAVKAKERELAIAKAQNNSLSEQYRIEDELLALKSKRANENLGFYSVEAHDIDENRKKLMQYQQQLADALDAKASGEGDVNVDLKLNGEIEEQDVDEAIDALQGIVDNLQKKIEIGIKAKDDAEQVKVDAAKLAEERRQAAQQAASVERSAMRETESLRISMMKDSYQKSIAATKAETASKIQDLNVRLSLEKDLTFKARMAINKQINLLQIKQNADLEKLEREHQQKLLAIRRQIEDESISSAPRTADQQRSDLLRQYERRYENVMNEITNGQDDGTLSQEEIEEKFKLLEAIRKRYQAELKILEGQLESRSLETMQKTIELRLAAVRAGSEAELELRIKQIEAERNAELAANKQLAKDEQQNEADIIAKYDKEMSDLLLSYDSEYQQWLDRLDELTVKELEKLLAAEKKALKELMTGLAGKDLTDKEQKQVNKLIAKITELENKIKGANLTPKQIDIEQWTKITSYVNDLGDAFKDLGGAIGGATGDVITSIGEITTTVGSTIDAVVDGIKMVEATEVAAIKAIESASVILAVISAAITIVQKIVDIISGEDEGLKELKAATKKYEDTIHDLTRAFELLNKEIDKAYGSDRSELIQKQIGLKQQEIDAENAHYRALKKRYDELFEEKWGYEERRDDYGSALAWINGYWSDDDQEELDELEKKLKESVENIEDLQREIKDLRQSMLDAIFGDDIQSAIERFADALTDAWEQGKDASESAKDFINNMIKDMFKQALLSAIENSDMMNKLRGMLKAWFRTIEMGINGTPQQISSYLLDEMGKTTDAGLRRVIQPHIEDIYAYGDSMAEAFSSIGDAYRHFITDVAGDREAQAKGIATASQESIDELNGRMTAVQGHTFNISENSNIIRDNIAAINGNVALIRDYTSNLVGMRSDMTDMRNDIQQIRQHGVQILSEAY